MNMPRVKLHTRASALPIPLSFCCLGLLETYRPFWLLETPRNGGVRKILGCCRGSSSNNFREDSSNSSFYPDHIDTLSYYFKDETDG